MAVTVQRAARPKHEFEALDLDAADKDGNPVIPDNAHARLASPQLNNGAQILRRAYSYNDSTNFYIERWPPWPADRVRRGADVRRAPARPAQEASFRSTKLAKLDIMNQFTTRRQRDLRVPAGRATGSYIGAALFDA